MIEVGKYAGFCGGVINSVKKSEEALEKINKLYCLGELVHNKQVVDSLVDKGLIIINSLDEVEDNSTVIIRAHGETKSTYDYAKKHNINLIDLTCPKVLKIHDEVASYKDKEFFIILVGSAKHPEVIGTISFSKDKCYILENMDDIDKVVDIINENNYQDIAVFSQTTYSKKGFQEIVNCLEKKLNGRNLIIRNTICNATSLRQDECINMAKVKDCMIIIGGKNSSNTKKLYEAALEYCKNTFIIETVEDLDMEEVNKYNNIGIMAGASTPKSSIDEVVNGLEK